MAFTSLQTRHYFGIKSDVSDALHFADDTTLVFPAGSNVVLQCLESRQQRFIAGTTDTEGISAMTLSANRKLLAVAEQSERATISVYDVGTLKRRKLMMAADISIKEYVSLSFSNDCKLLAAQGGGPDWTLVLWTWEKSKVFCTAKAAAHASARVLQCLFSPNDPTLLSLIGQGIFRLFKIVDGTLKQLSNALAKRDAVSFTVHAWIPEEKERLVVGTDAGEVLVVDSGELKSTIEPTDDGRALQTIVVLSKGFIAGTALGTLYLFEKSEDKDVPFQRTKTFDFRDKKPVCSLALSPSEESLMASLGQGHSLRSVGLSGLDFVHSDELSTQDTGSQSFHVSTITGIDSCVRKPLFVSSSSDRTIHIWNYNERTTEQVKVFAEEVHSVSFHPMGMHLLAGFSDKLRLLAILMDDIRPIKEYSVKSCSESRFSNGGHMFAAANSNTVQIYNTYSCENVGNLRGHNGKVQSIYWSSDDSRIITASMDGAVYEWKLKDFKRDRESVLKGCNYFCVVASLDMRSIFAVGSDRKLKELDDGNISKEFGADTVLTQMVLPPSSKSLFVATENGSIRAYKIPLSGEFIEYKLLTCPIIRLSLAANDTLLLIGGEDGSIAMAEVREKDGLRIVSRRDKETVVYAEEVLITRADLEEKRNRMAELEAQVNELTLQNEYQMRLKDLNVNETIKELQDTFNQELDSERTKFELLVHEKNEQEMEYEEKLKEAEDRSASHTSALEAQYQAKIMAEVERYDALNQEKAIQNEKWEEQYNLLIESHERTVKDLTQDYETRLVDEEANASRLEVEKEEASREADEMCRQLEEDADREIEDLKGRYEERLSSERETGLRLKGENGIMRKKFNALQKDIDEQKETINALQDQKRQLNISIKSLEKDIVGLKKEIRERDEAIGDKEKRIYDLKKKNQELEKFKFVLDYKIKELKKQIEPREKEVEEMKKKVRDMDTELQRYHRTNAALNLNISEQKLKLNALQSECGRQARKSADKEAIIKNFVHDLQETCDHIQHPKELKESVKKLHNKYISQSTKPTDVEEEVRREQYRQLEHLERTVDSLKKQLAKDVQAHATDKQKAMAENIALLKEVNELRRELKNLKQQQRSREVEGSKSSMTLSGSLSDDLRAETDMQRKEIVRLRKLLALYEEDRIAVQRPVRESLPPMDGFHSISQDSMPRIEGSTVSLDIGVDA